MSTDKNPRDKIVRLNLARLSFPRLFTPKVGDEGGKAKYEATFLLDKQANAADIAAMRAAINAIYHEEKDRLFKNKPKPKVPALREGGDKTHLEGYSDRIMFVGARTHMRPGVVDRNKQILTETDGKPYAGCYVNGTVVVYPFVHPKSGPMICAQLRAVQFVKHGEPFGNAPVDTDKEFEALPDDNSAVDERSPNERRSAPSDDLI